jgi:ribosomal protein S18 acetylase RimI-like enzyme
VAVFSRFASRAQTQSSTVEPLLAAVAVDLRLPFLSRLTPAGLVTRIQEDPGLAFVAAGTGNYALGSHWRRRPDIGEICEISRGPYQRALLHRILQAFEERGVALVLLDYDENTSEALFYESEGFVRMERIVEYVVPSPRLEHWAPDQDIVPYDRGLRTTVMEVERESFPWMWRNSPEEMAAYEATSGVEIYVIKERSRVAGYAGITNRGPAVHLDRLAVRRTSQGHGLGGRLVAFTIKRAEDLGARRLSLSTQSDNMRSQQLYQRFGFRRGRWSYDIRGIWLQQPVEERP